MVVSCVQETRVEPISSRCRQPDARLGRQAERNELRVRFDRDRALAAGRLNVSNKVLLVGAERTRDAFADERRAR